MSTYLCPFCESQVSPIANPRNLVYSIHCQICGYFRITDVAMSDAPSIRISKDDKVLFSGHLRNYSTEDNQIMVTGDMLSKINQIVAPYKNLSVLDKIDKLVRYIGENSKFIEDIVVINCFKDYPIAYCKNQKEFESIIIYLRERKMLRTDYLREKSDINCVLTVEGWQKYENVEKINPQSKKVFVAMSFDNKYDDLFDKAIAPACDKCGFVAVRVDRTQHNQKICDRIIAEIKQSRFVIADFTGQNNGVYYEAGYAQGIGLEVIKCCNKDEIDNNKLHFDIRQYKHIPWETIDDLRSQLIESIEANIKRTINKE